MEEGDLGPVTQMEADCFDDAWNEESIAFELHDNPFCKPYVIEEDGQIAGYLFLWVIFERAEIANIAIDPKFRRHGLGRQLMEQAIEKARAEGCETMMLEVRLSNTAAQALYKSMGFVEMRRVGGYYSNGEDAIVMALGL